MTGMYIKAGSRPFFIRLPPIPVWTCGGKETGGPAGGAGIYGTGIDRAEQEADLARLVERLPEKQREIVLLRFAQDLTLRETADVLGLPLRTVQSRLRAALKYLKKILKEGGETDAK